MKRVWLIGSWVAATAIVSFVTFQVLSAADGGVRDRPLTPVIVDTIPVDVVSEDLATGPTPRPAGTHSTPAVPDVSTTEPLGGPTTPGTTPDPTTTTTPTVTSSTVTTTTTTVADQWTTTTITSGGGNVTVSYRPGEVKYEAAVPAPGYTVEIESTGPEVRVEFTTDDGAEYEIRARWNEGAFEPRVEEHD